MTQINHVPPDARKQLDIQIDKLVKSYLERKANIHDESESINLETEPDRSTPQGSSVSPKFWRIHDHLFTTRFHHNIRITIRTNSSIITYSHIAYADDYVICLAVKIRKATPENTKDPRNIPQFLANVEPLKISLMPFELTSAPQQPRWVVK